MKREEERQKEIKIYEGRGKRAEKIGKNDVEYNSEQS